MSTRRKNAKIESELLAFVKPAQYSVHQQILQLTLKLHSKQR